MGSSVRWPLLSTAQINLDIPRHCCVLLVLAFLFQSAACLSPPAESQTARDPSASHTAKQLAQSWYDRTYGNIDSARQYLEALYWQAREGRLELSVIICLGALVCFIQALILWKMTSATPNNEQESKSGGEANDGPTSLWTAWRIHPEMGTYSSSKNINNEATRR